MMGGVGKHVIVIPLGEHTICAHRISIVHQNVI
jgi:hypothetical protein